MTRNPSLLPTHDTAELPILAGGTNRWDNRLRVGVPMRWLVIGWMGACTAADEGTPTDTGADPAVATCRAAPFDITRVRWEDCGLPVGAECASVRVPLDPCDPDDDARIRIDVKRLATGAPTQLWFLDGGPGGSGLASFDAWVGASAGIDADVYTLDHRGVGGADHLSCPDQEAAGSPGGTQITADEQAACLASLEEEWGGGLEHFTTTNAAHDVASLVEHLRGTQKVVIYGVSYGTYLAHRYLQHFGDQPDAVVLDSAVSPSFSFLDWDVNHERKGEQVMERCAEDATCAARLGRDPWALAQGLRARLASGHCPDLGITDPHRLLAGLLYRSWTASLVPPLVYRLDRCEPRDIDAWRQLATVVSGPVVSLDGFSRVLNRHVAVSELIGEPDLDSLDALADVATTCAMCSGGGYVFAVSAESWPPYPAEPDVMGQLADYDGPLLVLQGGLDPATTTEDGQVLAEHFLARRQTYVEMDHTGHAALGSSPTVDGDDCGLALFRAFVAGPRRALDTTCQSRLAPLRFPADPALSEVYLGTLDAWD